MVTGESVKEMSSKFSKLDKFQGQDFRRWKKKMHFLLTTLKVVYVLSTPMPEETENETLDQQRRRLKWENDDYICRGHILNGMSDALFDVHQNAESARELWDALEAKYMAEDSSSKKFLVTNFNSYKMVDSRPIMEQFNELLHILGQFEQHKMHMDESISVSSIIDKLPPQWKDFKHTLKHRKEDLSLVQLGSHLRIEESLRSQEIGKGKGKIEDNQSTVNMVEHANKPKKFNKDQKGKRKFKGKFPDSNKKQKFTCWNCGKPGNLKRDCRVKPGVGNKSADSVGPSGSKDPPTQMDDLVAWWVDSGATIHVCKYLRWFDSLKSIEDGSVLRMRNVATEPIKGDEALGKFKIFKQEVELSHGILIKTLRTDRGGEYYDPTLFQSTGIIHQTTAPYTPQQNGVAERKNRTLKEMVNSLLSYSGLSDGFWGEAMLTACYILNRTPNKRNKVTPYELWKGKPPNLYYLKVWGCRAVVRLTEPKRKNLGERGIDCIFIGYAENSKAYRFYVLEPNDSVPRDISQNSESRINDSTNNSSTGINNTLVSSEPRKSVRTRKAKSFGSDFHLYLIEGSRNDTEPKFQYCYNIEEDPISYKEAMASRYVLFWKEVIQDEMDSIMQHNTWKLTDLPPGCKPLGNKWIFKRKMKVDGSIDKFKARLVVQGFRQKEGIDFFDTYAPVARISTIRLLVALASIHNLIIHQMDVKTAFLNGELEEEVYMKQLEGFILPGNEHKVCKLIKSLYGLKQAPKQWHQKFDEVIQSNGFYLNQADKCVYSIFDSSGKWVIICLYVVDMLIFGTDQALVDETKSLLSSKFDMKDLGEADVILGIRIKRSNTNISLTQSHYIEKVLRKFNHWDCSSVSTPIDSNIKLLPNKGNSVSQLQYAKVIGSLMYAMISTRPDIAYAVGRLSRFTSFPSVIEGYSDVSWITNVEDHSSTTGWIFLLGGGAITWASKKQTCITNLTMESEFVALAAAGKEAEWLKNLIYEIPLWSKPISPISIRCDSAATLDKAYNHVYNGKSRHLGVRHSMIRELIMNGVISVQFVKSELNMAGHLNKGLTRDLVKRCKNLKNYLYEYEV
ncbi:hypothetical protein L1987_06515 [Smallanthus sonchifolius]|uniref:Uncharacterized protein n=1 Tax=Smallanthus sonchifolius TaxID=185202 RepID=A0ACB9JYJ5_9ASTR|nr:hypothetical protein L1987_06515 [Smallanthus sonchifolius]